MRYDNKNFRDTKLASIVFNFSFKYHIMFMISACPPGYTGNACSMSCPPTVYGQGCQYSCGTCSPCHHVHGCPLYLSMCRLFVLLYILIWKTSSIPVIIQRKVSKRNSKNLPKCIIINVNLQNNVQ